MSRSTFFLKILLPFFILILGGAGMAALILSRQPPPREMPEIPGALVEVTTVERADHQVRIYATGTVQPRHEAAITPQVSGLVVNISPNLTAGGRFVQGEPLFALESADYRLAVERAQAALIRAELDLQTMESQAQVARAEWQRLEFAATQEPNPLVVFEPQVANAKAAVAAARAQVEQAQLELARTQLHAPFNALIRSAQVERGQFLRAGNPVANIIGTDRAEIIVPLPFEDMARLQVPSPGSTRPGSTVTILLTLGERTLRWQGQVVRSLGEVDERGRMARVVVAVEDPYNLRGTWPKDYPALEMGLFVQVELLGDRLRQVIAIPRSALREADQVWVAGPEDRLQIRPVQVLRREQETLFIGEGLEEGERLILTHLMGAADGMKLRPRPAQGLKP